jgi:hypothetical protein
LCFWHTELFLSLTKFIFTYTQNDMIMQRTFRLLVFSAAMMILAPSCNHNKIACPAYADSVPESTKKSKKPEAPKALPKGGKTGVSHSMGPGGK